MEVKTPKLGNALEAGYDGNVSIEEEKHCANIF